MRLSWKPNHPDLPTNEAGSKRRLANLVKRLESNGTYERYDEIIQDQLKQGVIETAPPNPTKKEIYIPHKGVAKQDAESTKLRIVYDASAKGSNTQPSLNDRLPQSRSNASKPTLIHTRPCKIPFHSAQW